MSSTDASFYGWVFISVLVLVLGLVYMVCLTNSDVISCTAHNSEQACLHSLAR